MPHTHLVTAPTLPIRPRDMHKGDAGKLLLVGGSVGYTGALTLSAKAALRTGAGLVFMGVPEDIYQVVASANLEAMPFPLPKDNLVPALSQRLETCDTLLLGPGLGQSPELDELVCTLIQTAKVPVILDADGLNAVSRHIDILDKAQAPLILTPHEGEFTRLGGDLSKQDRLTAARAFAERHQCILVLKGPGTISAFPDGSAFVNQTGNPGMAKGGSGDVLAGILTALIGQGFPLEEAVPTGVWIHGKAGDLAAHAFGEYSMLPTDTIDMLPEVLKSITR